ncbi:MAG: hypothetical protein CMJ42_06810 [Phyllobacteriaceae bacterium]|nr:hypothetical protein [Phyllobacteriaceae bacterium]
MPARKARRFGSKWMSLLLFTIFLLTMHCGLPQAGTVIPDDDQPAALRMGRETGRSCDLGKKASPAAIAFIAAAGGKPRRERARERVIRRVRAGC